MPSHSQPPATTAAMPILLPPQPVSTSKANKADAFAQRGNGELEATAKPPKNAYRAQ